VINCVNDTDKFIVNIYTKDSIKDYFDGAIIFYNPKKNDKYHQTLLKTYAFLVTKTAINLRNLFVVDINNGMPFDIIVKKLTYDQSTQII
jgi:uncharacterized membrane protein